MRSIHGIRTLGTLFTAVLSIVLSPASGFADSQSKPTAERPPILRTIEQQGIRIVGEMEVPGGLRAFAAKAGAQPLAIYLTPDNQHVIVGTLVDAYGQDMAAEQLKTLLEAPLKAEEWQKLERSTWVRDGKEDAPRIVYAFTDPNCPYCNKFWHAARPWVETGKVQLRHVMVGVIRQDLPGKAAAISRRNHPRKPSLKTRRSMRKAASRPCNR
ncbi:MAG: thiol:disulfide interchange protein DsbG [Micropruina sp.]|uniref:thiol:disulfide interchange protein DsbG n=1 Tax=Micropruina sp. TaxID=2737536 RepID=UPI0039E3CAF3